MIDHLFIKCRQHGGPFTSVAEAVAVKDSRTSLRQELQYQKLTHPKDALNRRDLYKVNGLSAEAMFNNLKDLIDPNTEQQSEPYVAFLSQDEVLEILKPGSGSSTSSCNTTTTTYDFEYQQPVATVWDKAVSKQWYVGFVIAHSQSDDKLVVDHLERKGNKFEEHWGST